MKAICFQKNKYVGAISSKTGKAARYVDEEGLQLLGLYEGDTKQDIKQQAADEYQVEPQAIMAEPMSDTDIQYSCEYAVFVYDTELSEYVQVGRAVETEFLARNRFKEQAENGRLPGHYDISRFVVKRRVICQQATSWDTVFG